MSQVKKISVATVCGKIKLSELIAKKVVPLMEVTGMAIGVKTGISSYGEWKALEGRFSATNVETGEVSEASVLFLPDVALVPIEVALKSPGTQGVEFDIRISAKYVAEDEGHKSGGSPYEYTFENLSPQSADDPIARIKARRLALAAPKTVEHAAIEKGAEVAAAAAVKAAKGKK